MDTAIGMLEQNDQPTDPCSELATARARCCCW